MKKIYTLIVLNLLITSNTQITFSQELKYQWSIDLYNKYLYPELKNSKLVVENNGDVIYANTFTIDKYDPESYDLVHGTEDINFEEEKGFFVQKIDESGTLKWFLPFYFTGSLVNITTDSFSNIYIAGYFSQEFDLDPGEDSVIVEAPDDCDFFGCPTEPFIIKLNPEGHFVWGKIIRELESNGKYEYAKFFDMKLKNDFLYFIGGSKKADFDTSPDEDIDEGPLFYAMKMDLNGNVLWHNRIIDVYEGLHLIPYAKLEVDNNGNLIVSGKFYGDLSFPNTSFDDISAPYDGGTFLVRINSDGLIYDVLKFDWEVSDFELDNDNNVLVTGNFMLTQNFNTGSEQFNMTADFGTDSFLAKYDTNFNFIWAKKIAGYYYEETTSIDIDEQNNIYITGRFDHQTDFNPSPSHEYYMRPLVNEIDLDIFIMSLDSDGNFRFAKSLGTDTPDWSDKIIVHKNNLYSIGYFLKKLYFNLPNQDEFLGGDCRYHYYVLKFLIE